MMQWPQKKRRKTKGVRRISSVEEGQAGSKSTGFRRQNLKTARGFLPTVQVRMEKKKGRRERERVACLSMIDSLSGHLLFWVSNKQGFVVVVVVVCFCFFLVFCLVLVSAPVQRS